MKKMFNKNYKHKNLKTFTFVAFFYQFLIYFTENFLLS